MQVFKVNIFVPFEVGDIIKYVDDSIKYKVLDIQHIFSAKYGKYIKIVFILQNIDTSEMKDVTYEENKFELLEY